ncbi:MAG: hypothetical protein VB078_07360 [Clostridiaceae bacterium]|nr:hypothetical protein [Clostridiaceae bacterium]
MIKKLILAAMFMASAALFSGCALQLQYGDGLLALPSLPAEYIELQSQINNILETGAVSAAAESGENRQSIQLVDIDGDGANETIAFFRQTDGNYLIKAYKKEAGSYKEIGSVEAVGLTLHSIYYPVSSVTGQKCLAVCWGIDESNNYGMTVYTFGEDGMEDILSVQYSGIIVGDFSGDSLDELCFAVKDQSSGQMTLKVYSLKGKMYEQDAEILLCNEVKNVSSMTLGRYNKNSKAIFLDSAAYGGGYVTDVVTYSVDGYLRDLSREKDSGSGIKTWRSIEIYCKDIDRDGILEVPTAYSMMSSLYSDEKNKLNWLEFGETGFTSKLKTYHMPSDDWYLKWMDNWDDRVVVQTTRYSRMVKTVFFLLPKNFSISAMPQPDESNTLLTLYMFSGDNRQAYISVYEAKAIIQKNGFVYAYALGKADYPEYAVTEENVLANFSRIENEWTLEDNGE